MTRVDVVVMVEVLFVSVLLIALVPRRTERRAGQTRCMNNLKQIGIAAICYADERRNRFPHVAAFKELDGGYTTSTTSRVFRALVYTNYLDNPETFVCPSGPDDPASFGPGAKLDPRRFRWDGSDPGPLPPGLATVTSGVVLDSPLVAGATPSDVALKDSRAISYGWTRRGLNTNSRSERLLAADKSRKIEAPAGSAAERAHSDNMVGNHRDCHVAVCVDAHTVRITPGDDEQATTRIAATERPEDGALGVLGDDPALGQ